MTEKQKDKPDPEQAAGANPDPFAMVAEIKTRGPAPVHLWDPPFCGDIDMEIRRDGNWVHEGRVVRRPAMVRLFASILKKENDRHYLVTPVEKVGIRVEDCPFLVVDMDVSGAGRQQRISFTTNTDEQFPLDSEHPLRLDGDEQEPHPVVQVRGGLEGLVSRAVFYRLVELLEEDENGRPGLFSHGHFFPVSGAEN